MASSASIAQEFYKVRKEWEEVDILKSWRLAIWVAEYHDVDIIDKFMETERLPIGVFDDIFFRFDTEYKGDRDAFEKALWEEYREWFVKPPREEYDMYTALKNDGLLMRDYEPDSSLAPTFENLMNELLRFKACIKGLEHSNFCLYFPPSRPGAVSMGSWFNGVLKKVVPQGIRLATIDFAAARRIEISHRLPPGLVAELRPQLDMMEAINNEMDKGGDTYDTVSVDALFRKQVRVVMNSTVKKDPGLTEKEVNTLLSLSRRMESPSAAISGLLIASQAYFSIGQHDKSEFYADDAIARAEAAMEKNDPAGYPTWKACMMLKGAIVMGKRKNKAAIAIYEKLAATASKQADAFFVMEGYRLSGHLHYESRKPEQAFETLLLSLVAGSYLEKEVRRQSTFLHAAYLALFVGRKVKDEAALIILEQQLEEWLGDDWRTLLAEEGVTNASTRQKRSLFKLSNE